MGKSAASEPRVPRMLVRMASCRRGYDWRAKSHYQRRSRLSGESMDRENDAAKNDRERSAVSEADIQAEIMIEATRLGHRLFRNQIGVAKYRRSGREWTVPYGVGGVGGADLIGWTNRPRGQFPGAWPQKVQAFFTAIECKSLKGAKRAEQQKFIDAVIAAGGIAGFCRSVDDYKKLVGAM